MRNVQSEKNMFGCAWKLEGVKVRVGFHNQIEDYRQSRRTIEIRSGVKTELKVWITVGVEARGRMVSIYSLFILKSRMVWK